MTATLRTQAGELRQIPVRDLVVSKHNPRSDVGDVSELEASIREHGVLEPLVVVRENGHFAVVAGSRRLAAAKKAHLGEVPAVVREMSEEDQAAAALIENLQRRDLAPLEEARGYRRWLDLTKKTQAELAKSVGKAPSTIANALRLLEAPQPIRHALENGVITPAHARVALELKDPALVMKLPLKAGVTVDELKARVDDVNAEAALNGAPAIAAAKAFLEKARADHPKATITWQKQKDFAYARATLDLVKALGKPPAAVVGPIGGHYGMGSAPTAAQHDKKCECRAYLIEASRDYKSNLGTGGLKLELRRVCIDRAGWKKARPKEKKPKASRTAAAASKPKELTPAQIAKREADYRKRLEAEAARSLKAPTLSGPGAAVARKLGTKVPADVARAVIAFRIAMDMYHDDAQLLAWERVLKMPGKKASQLAVALLADDLAREVFFRASQLTTATFEGRVAQHFGVKVAQPKPEPKAKKAAKKS